MRVGHAIPRFYYLLTPAFILLDYAVGVNVRTAALDAMPLYKNLYYGFCILCGIVVFVLPRASAAVALVESSIMVLLTAVSAFLPVLASFKHVIDLGGDWERAETIGIEGAANLLMSGSIAIVAFHLNLAVMAGRTGQPNGDDVTRMDWSRRRDAELLGTLLGLVLVLVAVAVSVTQRTGAGKTLGRVLVVLVILFGAPVAIYDAVKKRAMWKRVNAARAAGFAFSDISDDDWRRRLNVFPTFAQPLGRVLGDRFCTCVDGIEVLVFDVRAPKFPWWLALPRTHSARLATSFRSQTTFLCQGQDLALPQFFLHLRKVARHEVRQFEASLGEEVPIPSVLYEEYVLRGFEPDRIATLFTPEVVAYCLEHQGLQAEAMGDMLIVYRTGRFLPAHRLMDAVNEAVALLNLFKAGASRS